MLTARDSMIRTFRLDIGLVLLGILPIVYLLCVVPPVMDEFIHYQTLACLVHPDNFLNSFRVPCTDIWMSLFGVQLPMRAYPYIGASSSLLYAPIYWLWPSYQSARISGILTLVGVSFVLHAVSKLRWSLVFLLVAWFFPLVMPVVFDTGPVALQVAVSISVPYLLARFPASKGAIIFSAVLVFLALWNKFFFHIAFPFIGVWWLYLVFQYRSHGSSLRPYLLAVTYTGIGALILTLPILLAVDFNNTPFWRVLVFMGQPTAISELLYRPKLLRFFDDFSLLASRHYTAGLESGYVTALWGAALGVTIVLAIHRAPGHAKWVAASLLGLFLSYVLVARNALADNTHHVALLFVPILLVLVTSMMVLKRSVRLVAALTVAHVAFNGVFFYTVLRATPYIETEESIVDIHRYLNSSFPAATSLFVVNDWGLYYLQSVYGPQSQAVVYPDLSSLPQLVPQVSQLARSTGRKPIFIGRIDRAHVWLPPVREYYPDLPLAPQYHPQGGHWAVWFE